MATRRDSPDAASGPTEQRPAVARRGGGRRARMAAGRAALVLLGLALAVLVADTAFRVVMPARADELLPLPYRTDAVRQIADGEAYVAFDELLGWRLRPGARWAHNGVQFEANAAGLRAPREYAARPDGATRRIAAFGDSFTFCDEVAYADCWSARLEQEWPGTEVLNYGVPGYGPDQAWLRYGREGRDLAPCAVLIGYMPENIHRVVNRFRPFYQPTTGLFLPKPRFLLDGDGLALLPQPADEPADLLDAAWVERQLGPHDSWYYPGLFARSPADLLASVRLMKTAAYKANTSQNAFAANDEARLVRAYEERGEAFEVARRVLGGFARQVKADGLTPVVVFFGRELDIVARRHGEDRVYEPLLDQLKEDGLATIDVTEALGREARRRSVHELVDKHYRPTGNAVVARMLAEKLPSLVGGTCG
jgi:hypothetical protein